MQLDIIVTMKLYISEVQWIRNTAGKTLALVNGYTYYCNTGKSSRSKKVFWRCTKGGSCQARFFVSQDEHQEQIITMSAKDHDHAPPNYIIRNEMQWIRNSAGKMLALVNGYTYYCNTRKSCNRKKDYWRCTRGGSCKAHFFVSLDPDQIITMSANDHDHAPPNYIIRNGHRNGKPAVIVNGFTYYCNKQGHKTDIWRCTNGSNCRARFTMSKTDWRIIRGRLEHDHKPPNFVVQDGVYFKI
ncbi:unnamed protein product [Chilo suppressalis]|uniref:FLYWCH-type domain-containing protein n=1 Tax=Chilo suppressalis TaxID=168631 RepID=A0ABN8AT65_CHISP|nr:unnamed protein product [Chilo suppressalis]